MRVQKKWLTLGLVLALAGCDDNPPETDAGTTPEDSGSMMVADSGTTPEDSGTTPEDSGTGTSVTVPDNYEFESQSMAGVSSVSRSGQTSRQILIMELHDFLGGLTGAIDATTDGYDPSGMMSVDSDPDGAGSVTDYTRIAGDLQYYFSVKPSYTITWPSGTTGREATRGAEALRYFSERDNLVQATWGALNSSSNLQAKTSPNDSATDRFAMGDTFAGWNDASALRGGSGTITPAALIDGWFATIEANAAARAAQPLADRSANPVYLTDTGLDLRQLINKTFHTALAFAQAADDYMDFDEPGKGLLASNEAGDSAYTALEHAWDEGLGYFGASNSYGTAWTAETLLTTTCIDSDGATTGRRFDAQSECNFGQSINAAKRDAGSGGRTDYVNTIWTGFRTGRAIITAAGGPLSTDQATALRAQRDIVINAWERVLMANAVHYINDVLEDMDAFGSSAYSFSDHAKHWAEMKAYAFAATFNRSSDMTDEQFAALHTAMGDAPVLESASAADQTAYRTALEGARSTLGTVYGWEEALLTSW